MYRENNVVILIAVVLFGFISNSISQTTDSSRNPFQLSGSVDITTKGISTIPSYTLGKPAMIFSMDLGGRLSFEPEFRYSLEGKPWMLLLWGRYDLVDAEKFHLRIGMNPSLVIKDLSAISADSSIQALVLQRSLTNEFYPSYSLTKNIRIGTYYMYVLGFESFAARHKHYLALRFRFLDLKILNQFYVNFSPQIYYLKVDEDHGFFLSSSLDLYRRDFPLSVHALFNKMIQSAIPGSTDFLWNISLRYSFAKKLY